MDFNSFVPVIGLFATLALFVWHQQHNFNRLWDELRSMRKDTEGSLRELRQEFREAHREAKESTENALREMRHDNRELRQENREAHREARVDRAKLWNAIVSLGQRLARIEGKLDIVDTTEAEPGTQIDPLY
ncbi:MAG: hypothetical protein KTU85_02410 [Acidimicrobiia bacterium]|nr:hypothetical protein [Acidimicrobiia bacterium]MCY4456736.1 hypothetical protein [Acidimicrobiaceae bacterium]